MINTTRLAQFSSQYSSTVISKEQLSKVNRYMCVSFDYHRDLELPQSALPQREYRVVSQPSVDGVSTYYSNQVKVQLLR